MHAATVVVPAVPVERIMGDRRHRPQAGQRAPQAIAGADMGGVQLARLAAEEALAKIMRVPQVQITDLRALDADDTKERSGRHFEGFAVARRHRYLGNPGHGFARLLIQRKVGWR